MPKSWSRGSGYCSATNRDGEPCGNKVATLPSGARIHSKCAVHRRLEERERREARKAKARPDYDPRVDHPERYRDGPI